MSNGIMRSLSRPSRLPSSFGNIYKLPASTRFVPNINRPFPNNINIKTPDIPKMSQMSPLFTVASKHIHPSYSLLSPPSYTSQPVNTFLLNPIFTSTSSPASLSSTPISPTTTTTATPVIPYSTVTPTTSTAATTKSITYKSINSNNTNKSNININRVTVSHPFLSCRTLTTSTTTTTATIASSINTIAPINININNNNKSGQNISSRSSSSSAGGSSAGSGGNKDNNDNNNSSTGSTKNREYHSEYTDNSSAGSSSSSGGGIADGERGLILGGDTALNASVFDTLEVICRYTRAMNIDTSQQFADVTLDSEQQSVAIKMNDIDIVSSLNKNSQILKKELNSRYTDKECGVNWDFTFLNKGRISGRFNKLNLINDRVMGHSMQQWLQNFVDYTHSPVTLSIDSSTPIPILPTVGSTNLKSTSLSGPSTTAFQISPKLIALINDDHRVDDAAYKKSLQLSLPMKLLRYLAVAPISLKRGGGSFVLPPTRDAKKVLGFMTSFLLNYRFYLIFMARSTFQAMRPLLAFCVFGEVMKLALAVMSSGMFIFFFSFVLAFEVFYFFLQCYISYVFLGMFFAAAF